MSKSRFFRHNDLKIVFLGAIYYSSAHVGFLLSFPETLASPVWPPTGIAFALILIMGHGSWPGLMIGSFIVHSLIFWRNGLAFDNHMIFATFFVSTGNTLEALLGFFLIKRFVKEGNPYGKALETFKFLFITLFISFLGALIGTSSLVLNGIIDETFFAYRLFSWWVGGTVSILLFSTVILSFILIKSRIDLNWRNFGEVMAFLVILGLLVISVFFFPDSPILMRALPFLIVPFMLWLAFRFNLQAAMLGVLLVSILAIYFTVNNEGPFIMNDSDNSLLMLQIFIGVLSITTIILSSTVSERTNAESALRRFNENLEALVSERTKKLNEEIVTRKKVEEGIRKSNEELKKTNHELDSFVYSVSHDLRAPIASVKGLTDLALREADSENMRNYLQMISNSAEKQDVFIREILDLSRNARLEVERSEINFDQLINDVFEQQAGFGSSKRIFKKEIKIDQQIDFYSDLTRIKVICNNLISNSIRYTNCKGALIKVDVSVDESIAKIIVSDNGQGIEEIHLEKIFDMFYRGSEDSEGSGLGLYIVKETLTKLNGTIKIDSFPGNGTTVTITIPQLLNSKAKKNGHNVKVPADLLKGVAA